MTSGLVVPENSLISWHGHARVEKFWEDDDVTPVYVDPDGHDLRSCPVWRRRATPYEVVEAENLLLTAGATLVLNRLAGISATAIDATNGRIAVGDGNTAVSAGQTDLQGTNKYRQVFDAVPTVSGNQLQAVATVGRERHVHLAGDGAGQRRLGRHPGQPVPHADLRREGRGDAMDRHCHCHHHVDAAFVPKFAPDQRERS
jgi:hypothetical protein